jgi:predicted phage terminase large subunit-like protein
MSSALAPVRPAPSRAPAVPLSAIHGELARRSLSWFVRLSWTVLEPTEKLIWNWHIEAICAHVQALLEGRIPQRNLLCNVPPGSMKSRIVSVCTTPWVWLHDPSWRAIYASGNPDVAIRDSSYARDLIDSDWYQHTFQPTWRWAPDQNAKGHYRNTARGERRALSTGAKITGNRANALFVDDALDAREAPGLAAREAMLVWYRQAFSNRLANPSTGTRCVIEQRLHGGDLSGYLLDGQPGMWEHLCIRQEYETPKENETKRITGIGWSDPRTSEGELMNPERFPPDFLAGERIILGSAGYAGQHQQRPTSADTNGDLKQLIEILGITRIVQGWDTALTEKKSSDFTAGCTIGVAPNRFYVLDLYKKKSEFPEAKKAVILYHAKWGASAVPVEGGGSASGKVTAQELRRETRVPVIEVPSIDKVVGMNKIAPSVEAGSVYLPEDAPWVADFVESLCTFPLAVHDDDADAFRIALDYAISGGGGMGMFEWMRQQAVLRAAAKAPAVAT